MTDLENNVISLTEIFSNTNLKCSRVVVGFLNSTGVVWAETFDEF